jgi:hypothetical protein
MKCSVIGCPRESLVTVEMGVYIKNCGDGGPRTVEVDLCEEHCTLPSPTLAMMFENGQLRVRM